MQGSTPQNGKKIDLSKLTESQKNTYDAAIKLLKSSKVFAYYYDQLEKSSTVYTLTAGSMELRGKPIGGYYDSKTHAIGVGNLNTYVVAQELFHAYQDDGKFYKEDLPEPYSTIETEADIMTIYVVLDAGAELPSYGSWSNTILENAMEKLPTSK